jgi:branched-chain amino acid transport system ATP-binding protein
MFQVSQLNSYYGKVQKLKSVNLTVKPGEIVAVIGANGSGKSTLMGAIAGLYRPIQGDITLFGKSIAHLPADKIIREGLSLVPEGRQIFANLTVRENLILGMYHQYRQKRSQVKNKIDQMLELFPGLQKHMNNLGGNLSGGEQQMLAIARGLMSEPKILLLDEPSIGLAPMIVAEILKTLQHIKDEMGTMVLLVEQNVKAALKVANRAYIMDRGEITLEGPAGELLENPVVQSTYLGYEESASTEQA